MDEDKKINIENFFGPANPDGMVMSRDVTQKNTEQLTQIKANQSFIQSLEKSIEVIQGEVQEITNYLIVQQEDKSRELDQREDLAFRREDESQKAAVNIKERIKDKRPFGEDRTFLRDLVEAARKGMKPINQSFRGLGLNRLKGFYDGGVVSETGPAIVHQGEFVATSKAKDLVGAPLLAGINEIADKGVNSESDITRISEKRGIDPTTLMNLVGVESSNTGINDLLNLFNTITSGLEKLPESEVGKSLSNPEIPKKLEGIAKQFAMPKDQQRDFAKTIMGTVINQLGSKIDVNNIQSVIENTMNEFGVINEPPPEQTIDNIVLPPIEDLSQSSPESPPIPPSFNAADATTTPLVPTGSGLNFIRLIENDFLSTAF